MPAETPSLDHPTFLQRSTDRDAILDRLLADLTRPCAEYPNDPVSQPVWGAAYTVGAHLAVKHPSRQSFFRQAGDPDYNIYRVPYDDLVTVLDRYEFVVKSATYPDADEKLLLYEGYNHELNDAILPSNATETVFLTVGNRGNGPKLLCVTADHDTTVDADNNLHDAVVDAYPVDALPTLTMEATSLYCVDSPVVPRNFTELAFHR